MYRTAHGFTLTELIVALLVAATLSAVAAPSLKALVAHQQVTTAANQVQGLIYQARSLALSQGSVYLCDLEAGCDRFGKTQRLGLLRQAASGPDLTHQLIIESRLPSGVTLEWKRFRGQHLHFTLRGTLHFQNGHFLLCHHSKRAARKVIMNWIGKSRIEPADAALCS